MTAKGEAKFCHIVLHSVVTVTHVFMMLFVTCISTAKQTLQCVNPASFTLAMIFRMYAFVVLKAGLGYPTFLLLSDFTIIDHLGSSTGNFLQLK